MKRKTFLAVCNNCCHTAQCLCVIMRRKSVTERIREASNLCSSCRKFLRSQWVWPTPTSKDEETEKALRAQDALRE